MYDIIKCSAEASSFGFSNFFNFESVKNKIVIVENLEAAANYKNKKVLIVLNDYAFDEGAIRIIAEKKQVCFLIDLGRLIRSHGISRAVAFSKIRNFLRLCVKYGAYYSFASFADTPSKIRTSDELQNLILLFDLNPGQAKFALKMVSHYLP
ncbi:RNase P subunit p30 [Candidatus Bilamarchaeum dharawalense]|uniref:RNase P subunit p30 n=1 Tax=Candidatus Bilamarchaeum dharawalense TaxID=2885759 RepID=A0A5E4LMG6_9ARCH|nr:RNase P subunit p30 [Candidatus Bilamarchaeum dharawalense]